MNFASPSPHLGPMFSPISSPIATTRQRYSAAIPSSSDVCPFAADGGYPDDLTPAEAMCYNALNAAIPTPSYLYDDPPPLAPIIQRPASVNLNGFNPEQPTISLSGTTERPALSHRSTHKVWAMLSLNGAPIPTQYPSASGHFAVVIDTSSSMREDNKLAFVQATIAYLLTMLNSRHRFSLIQFSDDAEVVIPLLPCNETHKALVLNAISKLRPGGNTNLGSGILTALQVLQQQQPKPHVISAIMLFTDGLTTTGLQGTQLKKAIKDMHINRIASLHTFGYGHNHDSHLLQEIALASQGGVYYFVENTDSIPSTFAECVSGLLSTVAHDIKVRLVGQDGCRMVNFYTKFGVRENKLVKDYSVSLGSLYSSEKRTILMKLSLRKLDDAVLQQPLVKIVVTFMNTLTGQPQAQDLMLSVSRPPSSDKTPLPSELDINISRYTAASAIEQAIKLGEVDNFTAAQKQLSDAIMQVRNSRSAYEPYCKDLVADLQECAEGMKDKPSYQTYGVHYAHSYSTMYYLERSAGSRNLSRHCTSSHSRSVGYGYASAYQEEASSRAKKESTPMVTAYSLMYDFA